VEAFVNYATFKNRALLCATAGTVYAWMYVGGVEGANVGCTATNGGGCCGHPNKILAETTPTGLSPPTRGGERALYGGRCRSDGV
jgi:hypothetical protein